MQALFTTYAAAVKKPAEEDSGGDSVFLVQLSDNNSFPGFAVPPTALAPRTGILRVGTIRNKSAVDKNGASDDSLSASEVSLLPRKLQNLRETNILCTGSWIRAG